MEVGKWQDERRVAKAQQFTSKVTLCDARASWFMSRVITENAPRGKYEEEPNKIKKNLGKGQRT